MADDAHTPNSLVQTVLFGGEESGDVRIKASKKQLTPGQRAARAERAKRWREANPERFKAMKKAATEKRKEHYALKVKEWLIANREKHLDWRRNRYRNKLAPDIKLKIERALRARLAQLLKTSKIRKNSSVINLIGCSPDELRMHIQRQFTRGMGWHNYGRKAGALQPDGRWWEIDHIIPCASYDLTSEEEQRACFFFTNLRPLWGTENRKKSDNITVLL